jgi:broad specificity phosphatase PhoE
MMAGGALAGAGESGGRTVIYLARHGQTPLNESGVLGYRPALPWRLRDSG